MEQVNARAGKDAFVLPCYEIVFFTSEPPKRSHKAILAVIQIVQNLYPDAFSYWRDERKEHGPRLNVIIEKRKDSFEDCLRQALHYGPVSTLAGFEFLSSEAESRKRLPSLYFFDRGRGQNVHYNVLRLCLPIDLPTPEASLEKIAEEIQQHLAIETGYAGWSIHEEPKIENMDEAFYNNDFKKWLQTYPALPYWWIPGGVMSLKNGIRARSWLTYMGQSLLKNKLLTPEQAVDRFREAGANAELTKQKNVLLRMPGELSPANPDQTVGHALESFSLTKKSQEHLMNPGMSPEENEQWYSRMFPDKI